MLIQVKIKRFAFSVVALCLLAVVFTVGWCLSRELSQRDKGVLSVVVPVYNVEQYLPKCLDSIVNQTYENLDIICVDDGSTDRCIEILKDYKSRDSRIKVVQKENGGVSSARNAGMKCATGRYLTFADPDDYVDEGAYERCINLLEAEDADMVVFNYVVEPEGTVSMDSNYRRTYTSSFDLIDDSKIDHGYVWNKVFRRHILTDSDIWFKEDISFCEDNLFMKMVIPKSRVIVTCPDVFYHYCRRSGSIVSSVSVQKDLSDAVLRVEYLIDNYVKEGYTERYDWLLEHCVGITFDRIASLEDLAERKYYSEKVLAIIDSKLLDKVESVPSNISQRIEVLRSYAA